ncbi:hypothetical protein AC578_10922 [Pseudocercospora eumusae]|uniref:Uncharacterized protein n=1 Tax=Pseudocercospora eumusae TaxID=321146 RepID=A0A139GVQ5_9PEZI|nr:hypothetical protein AC578_10922 [Pseudocercospora eumusae]
MVKIKNSAGELRQRADELINNYRLLEGQYAALPLHRRRNLSAGTSWETFCAAAIFEGGIAKYCREKDGSLDILQSLAKESSCFQFEVFPIAVPWFADLAAFYRRAHDGARTLTTYVLDQERIVLAKLEWKYEQAGKLLTHINRQEFTVTAAAMSSRAMECFAKTSRNIASGMPEAAALKAAEDEMSQYSYDDDHFMATEGVRQWFSVDLSMPAWPSADSRPDFTKWQSSSVPTSQARFTPPASMPRVSDFSKASQSTSTNSAGISLERTPSMRDSQQNSTNSGGGWSKNSSKDAAANSMPPPPPLVPKVTHGARLAEYNARWKTLAPHEKNIPYPNPALGASGFQNRRALPYDQQKIALWSAPTIISVMTKRFFTEAFNVRTTLKMFSDDTSNVAFELQKNNSASAVIALRKTLKLESVKWHSERLSRRTGTPGLIDKAIGGMPGNVAVRSAVQELLEECDKFTNGARR